MAEDDSRRSFLLRVGLLLGSSTLLLTAGFVGVIAVMSRELTNLSGRLPWYIVVGALVFVVTIVILEDHGADGRAIIVTSVILSAFTLVLVPLALEGALYAFNNPDRILLSNLLLYFLAAAIIASGIAYWGVHHWREFTGQSNEQL